MEEREFSYIDNVKKFYKAKKINYIIDSMASGVDDIFNYINDLYINDEEISEKYINQLIYFIKKEIDDLSNYLSVEGCKECNEHMPK